MLLESVILERILLALFLSSVIGYEREHAHKIAGLRTHALVGLSSSLLAMIALYGFTETGGNVGEIASRIIANIVVGIGFIGAGAILRQDSKVIGTTTAATLWTVAAVGIAVGIGFTYAAIAVTLITYLVLVIFLRLENKLKGDNSEEDSMI